MTELPLDTIICGDNASVMAEWPDACIDMTCTSPPYDSLRTYSAGKPMSELWDFEKVAQQLWRVTKPGGVVVWVVADATVNGSETGTSFRQALRFMEIGFRLHDTMIWDKPWTNYGDTSARYAGGWEYMFVLAKDAPKTVNVIRDRPNVTAGNARRMRSDRRVTGDKQGLSRTDNYVTHDNGPRKGIWEIAVGGYSVSTISQPAVFPESLARDHILSWSNEGDVVLDPFCGSGTTPKMARAMGRRWIGIEINPNYCEIARRRLAQQLLPIMAPQTA